MKVALIPCGITEWHGEGRLLGRVELPLTSAGQQKCAEWAARLDGLHLERILHAPDELASQTAAVLARQLSVPTKALEGLAEVDIGLWAGLTESQLKTRYASAHRQLREAPLNVSPPGGESLSAASKRLGTCMQKQIKKNGKVAVGVVMRPFSFAMARCALEGTELSNVWETVRQTDEPVVIDFEPAAAAPVSE